MKSQAGDSCGPELVAMPAPQPAAAIALLTDAQLISNVADRSHAALAEIYDRHGTDVHRLAQRLRGRDAADDIVQDVFLRLWRKPGSFDPARGSLRSFLMLQAHGRCVDLIRSDNARRTRESTIAVDQQSRQPPVDELALARLAGEHAWRLLSGLREGERAAIVLAFFGGHSYRQVAVLLSQPEGTVKNRIRSGLRRLREQMGTPTADSRQTYSCTP
ncbi:sigma-70 family RNA polymerase sigma factor [soil metagenome]